MQHTMTIPLHLAMAILFCVAHQSCFQGVCTVCALHVHIRLLKHSLFCHSPCLALLCFAKTWSHLHWHRCSCSSLPVRLLSREVLVALAAGPAAPPCHPTAPLAGSCCCFWSIAAPTSLLLPAAWLAALGWPAKSNKCIMHHHCTGVLHRLSGCMGQVGSWGQQQASKQHIGDTVCPYGGTMWSGDSID